MKKLSPVRQFIHSALRFDSAQEPSAALLYSIVMATGTGLALLLAERIAVQNFSIFPLLGTAFAAIVSSIALIRRGSLKNAGIVILTTLMTLLMTLCYQNDGFHDAALIAVPGVLMVAGLILTRNYFYAFTAATLVAVDMLAYLEITGVIVNDCSYKTGVQGIIDVDAVLGITAVTIRALTTTLIMKFGEAQKNEDANILLAQTLKSVKDCVTITDLDEHIIFVNEAFLVQYGYAEQELLGKHISILRSPVVDADMSEHIYPATMDEGWHGELMNRRKDGTDFPIELWTSVVKNSSGAVRATVGVARDVTERRRVERQLLQAQKLDTIGTLAGGIAHDFNNLLAMILGAAELLHMQISAQPGPQKHVNMIITAAERGRSISRRLLNFSRPAPTKLEPVHPSRLVEELHEMLVSFFPKSIAVNMQLECAAGMIMGDAGQIHQALLNLALNAADAMENSGRLTIGVKTAEPEESGGISGEPGSDPFVVITVADEGTGMDQSTLSKIFDPFFSTKAQGKGTGLGLAIVHGIMKAHNGFIDVESTPGEGTTFSLYFPLIGRPEHQPEKKSHPADRVGGETILLVDDEALLREMLTDYLTACGFRVLTAANGVEALELYARHRRSIDLVITYLGMPGMDGAELYRQMRSIDASVKVIIASGFLDGVTKNCLLEMGISDVLAKPFNLYTLQSTLHAILSPPHCGNAIDARVL
jgi:two-component system, cell cycle sensor histidine kinase and response regulator CckA